MKIIILIRSGEEYYFNLHSVMAEAIGKAFTEMGNEVKIIALNTRRDIQMFRQEFNLGCSFVFTFDGHGSVVFKIKEKWLEELTAPFVCMCLDSPMYFQKMLDIGIKKLLITCMDYTHVSYVERYYNRESYQYVQFLPIGGVGALKNNDAELSFEKRDIDVLFCGNINAFPKRNWNSSNAMIKGLLNDAVDLMLASETKNVFCAFEEVLAAKYIYLPDINKKLLLEFFMSAERFVRSTRRLECFRALGEAGVPLTIYGGEGWKNLPFKHDFKINDSILYKDMLKMIGRAKVLLNVSSNFAHGVNDRIFNAMLSGTAVITDYSVYLAEQFEPQNDLLMYSWKDAHQIPSMIEQILSSKSKWLAMTESAMKKTQENHTWRSRAASVIRMVEFYNLMEKSLMIK